VTQRIDIATVENYSIPATVGEPPIGPSRGVVVMAHGIFTDKTENGRYTRQAEIHHRLGYRTLSFDLQGHGDHPVSSANSTIAGNVSDFDSVLRFAQANMGPHVRVVASSFGGSIFLLHLMTRRPVEFERVLLLNPVTDYTDTFLHPTKGELKDGFSSANWERLFSVGFMEPVPGFRLSRKFGIELLTLMPYFGFDFLDVPTLIVHGSKDESVSCEVTRSNSLRSSLAQFHVIEGADHAFAANWEERASFTAIERWFGGDVDSVPY
jgi:pimeloyl-ACP methyl ester carboxylesterase